MINLSPGPSQLYFTVQDHMKSAFRESIPSISHRSKVFEHLYRHATEGLRELLQLPPNFSIVFCASSTEIWERCLQNLVEEKCYHFVNGAFSKRFYEMALQLGKKPELNEVAPGESFLHKPISFGQEMIAVIHNESSTGVVMGMESIHNLKKENPKSLVVVDAVSSLPYPAFDYSLIDSVYFSVQKGFGLPAGLGVWIVNDKCIEKSEQLLAKGISIGSYHTLPQLHAYASKNQTPETPNVLGIYLLGKVVEDFLRKGITAIRKETEYKAATLYQTLESHPILKPFVSEKRNQSKTVIVLNSGDRTEELYSHLIAKGFQAGEGYGEYKKRQLRFANFPTHSKEQFETLSDTLAAYR